MSIKIRFDSLTKLYWPGQRITGTVDVEYNEPKPITKIAIHFKGLTRVKWAKKRKSMDTDYQNYTSEVVHFKHKLMLMGKDNKKSCILSPGLQSFPFRYDLPNNLPSSLDGKYGYTKYSVKAKVFSRPWTSDNSLEEAITVYSLVDLNEVTNAINPLQASAEKIIGINKPGILCAVVKAPVCGYIGGQIVPFTIDASNRSDCDVQSIDFQIVRREIFASTDPTRDTRTNEKVVKDVRFGPMEPWEDRSIVATIQFPVLVPSGLHLFSIIDVEYVVKVVFKVPSCQKDLRINQAIVVGTVPLLKPDTAPGGTGTMVHKNQVD